MIRLAEPRFEEADLEAVCRVLRSGRLVQGEQVGQFEEGVAAYTGAPHVAAVSSGTAALHVSLLAMGIAPGDAVFVPAFTFPATANVVELVGARPVLVDVDPATYCVTPAALGQAVESWPGPEKPRAVIPVHEFGAPCEMDELCVVAKGRGLAVVEDAACALGTRWNGRHVGTFGDLGCFSWHPRKAITTGEGGAVTTGDPDLHRRVCLLRNHGQERRADGSVDFVLPGLNCRLTEFQAVLGAAQLARFPAELEIRRGLARHYLQELRGVPGLRLPRPVSGHAWQTFLVVLPEGTDRGAVIRALAAAGIEANLGAQALHRLAYYRERYGYRREDYPVAAELFERGLALPLHASVSEADASHVARSLREALQP